MIGGSKNELSVRTYRALGATIKALIPGGPLEGLDAAEQVAHRGAHLRAGVVLFDRQPEVAQVARDCVGDGTFLAGRAGQRGKLQEQVDNFGGH